jgi:hypothetical protein
MKLLTLFDIDIIAIQMQREKGTPAENIIRTEVY